MRIMLIALAALLVVGLVVTGCPKQTEEDAGPVTPIASPKPAGGAAAEVAPGAADALTLKGPGGEALVVTPGGDESWLKDAGLEPYPGGKLHKIDVDATVEAAKEASEDEMTESEIKAMSDGLAMLEKAVVYQTSDSFEDVRKWADGLEGFTPAEITEEEGVSSFEINADDEASFVGGNVFQMADDEKTRYVMLVDASAMMEELEKTLEAGLADLEALSESGVAESVTESAGADKPADDQPESKPADADKPAAE